MRPGHNRRMRGRNNNNSNNSGNRKSPNPLQRSYESNGPDVKVRGTAQHVAEKYLQLARDAQSSGDPVSAESYFQYAEHYYRILLAGQEQMAQQFGHTFPPNRNFVEESDDVDDEGEEEFNPGQQPQPYANGNGHAAAPREDGEGDGQQGQRFDRPYRNDRQDRGGDRPDRQDRQGGDRNGRRFDRPERGERRFDRQDARQDTQQGVGGPPLQAREGGEQPEVFSPPQGERRPEREPRPERDNRGDRPPRGERRPRREPVSDEAADETAGALPSFLTNPVRVPIAVPNEPAATVAETEAPAAPVAGVEPVEAAEDSPAKRTRRRRSPREVMDALGAEGDAAE